MSNILELFCLGFVSSRIVFMILYALGNPQNCDCDMEYKPFGTTKSILHPYGEWLAKMYCEALKDGGVYWYLKPIGLCPYCFGFWVNLTVCIFYGLQWHEALLTCAVGHYFLRG
jgi:hypothetical protein